VRIRADGGHFFVEGQISGARAGTGPACGLRPASLSGYDGRGWALRVRWRPLAGTAASAVIAGSQAREMVAAVPTDRRRGTLAVAVEGRAAPGWYLTGRYSWRGSRAAAIAATAPWAPPQPCAGEDDRTLAFGVDRRGVGWRCDAGLRTLVRAEDQRPFRRSLLAARAELDLASGWMLRCSWAVAWGAEVDLIGVTSPLPGQSVLRHWGRWREELVGGLQRQQAGWRWQIAVSARQPVPPEEADTAAPASPASSPPRLEIWTRGTFRW
jgi:hypothetical protein